MIRTEDVSYLATDRIFYSISKCKLAELEDILRHLPNVRCVHCITDQHTRQAKLPVSIKEGSESGNETKQQSTLATK